MSNSKSLASKTITGMFWMLSGKGVQAILQFVVLILLARLLTPNDFGIINAAIVVISFTTVFSMIGVGPALIQRSELTNNHIRTGFTITLMLSVFFSLLMFLGSPIIASFFKMDELIIILKVMSIIFILKGVGIVSESLLQRKLKFNIFVRITVLSYVVYGVTGVVFALLGFNYWSLVIAHILQNLVQTLLLVFSERHDMRLQLDGDSMKELIFFGGGFTIARISNQFALQADNLVVGRWLGANDLGLYSRAYQLMVMPTNLFGQVIDKVLFPAMAQVQSQEEKLTTSFRLGISTIALLTIPTSIFFVFYAKEIVLILFGKDWLELVPALQILAIGLLFRTSYKISDSIVRATGAVYKRAWRQVIYAIAVTIGAWIGQHWGIEGVAIGVLIAISINYFLMTNLSLKFINIKFIEVILLHIPSLYFGIVSVISILLIKWLTTYFIIYNIFQIILSSSLFIILSILFIKCDEKRFLGKDVVWLKAFLIKRMRQRKIKS